jgi:hypothetical protein
MPIIQSAIVEEIPEPLRGRSWPPPASSALTPTCDAEEIPGLAAEGITGPIRVLNVSSYSVGRRDGLPLLWRVEFCCVEGVR